MIIQGDQLIVESMPFTGYAIASAIEEQLRLLMPGLATILRHAARDGNACSKFDVALTEPAIRKSRLRTENRQLQDDIRRMVKADELPKYYAPG